MKTSAVIEDIRIASPCPARWDEMRGDEHVRFCAQCQRNVYNISALNAREAGALIAEREGRVCVRLYRRGDGTVLTSDCPMGAAARMWGFTRAALSAAAVAILGMAGVVGFARAAEKFRRPDPPHVVPNWGRPIMGDAIMGSVEAPAVYTPVMGKVGMGPGSVQPTGDPPIPPAG